MDYVTLYVADQSMIGSKTLDKFSNAISSYSSKSDGQNAIGMTIKMQEAVVDCNFMSPEKMEDHINGLNGFISEHLQAGIDIMYPLSRIYNVRLVMGCVVNPGFDQSGKVLEFIKLYNNELRSMMFYNNALWDYDGQCLASIHPVK